MERLVPSEFLVQLILAMRQMESGVIDEEKERRDLQTTERTGSLEDVKKALDPAALLGVMPEMEAIFNSAKFSKKTAV